MLGNIKTAYNRVTSHVFVLPCGVTRLYAVFIIGFFIVYFPYIMVRIAIVGYFVY